MKKYENILVSVAEECAEIEKATAKALRFGLQNYHPENPDVTNADEMLYEYLHLSTLIEMLQESGYLPKWDNHTVQKIKSTKQKNIAKYQEKSKQFGTVEE